MITLRPWPVTGSRRRWNRGAVRGVMVRGVDGHAIAMPVSAGPMLLGMMNLGLAMLDLRATVRILQALR